MEQDIQWYKINLLVNVKHATSLTFLDPIYPVISPAPSSRSYCARISTLSILRNRSVVALTMPKQKDKVRQSVEAPTGDKAVEPAARQPAPPCDDMPADFMSFVRSALNAVNKKLDNNNDSTVQNGN